MEAKDVKVGMKVIPHGKTADYGFTEWKSKYPDAYKFLLENGFLYVAFFGDFAKPEWQLHESNDPACSAGWFRASDFSPATIGVGDVVLVKQCLYGGHPAGTEGAVFEVNVYPGGTQYGVRHDNTNKWHLTDEIDLVRKAKCAVVPNSETPKPADRRPTVGDWVEVVENATFFNRGFVGQVARVEASGDVWMHSPRTRDDCPVKLCRVKLTTPPEQPKQPEQKPREFKVGDRVVSTCGVGFCSAGMTGTIVGKHRNTAWSVDFGKEFGGHDCDCLKTQTGWWVLEKHLEHVTEPATVLKSDADAAVRRAFIAGQEQIGKASVKVDYTIDYNPSAETLAKFFEADA